MSNCDNERLWVIDNVFVLLIIVIDDNDGW